MKLIKSNSNKKNVNGRKEFANTWIEVVDIKGIDTYLKDRNIINILNIEPIPFDLLSEQERNGKIESVSEALNKITVSYQILFFGKPSNMDEQINYLYKKFNSTNNVYQKKSLRQQIDNAISTTRDEKVTERCFYILLKDIDKSILHEEIIELNKSYTDAGLRTKILEENEAIEFFNIFYNPVASVYEDINLDEDMLNFTFYNSGE